MLFAAPPENLGVTTECVPAWRHFCLKFDGQMPSESTMENGGAYDVDIILHLCASMARLHFFDDIDG
ncbi:hypothetical protein ELE36_14735 [Pseudolysobacter antarcticus]|uniref:Uncharacterized protein n=1 Tax=Pseudolysobacter antarcticus TaxID=2511995 RepID=A0A411HLV2_9GAMM|nr:hypothetical protein [Pseudolysobacter antarcticus]QBB71509.1 hypothetical protein ELE36_14735 [Pseudolysobacter antarcticus]